MRRLISPFCAGSLATALGAPGPGAPAVSRYAMDLTQEEP